MGQKKSEIFFSNAEWTKIQKSDDSHDSYERARAVCLMLLGDYGSLPCNIRGYCKKVWVTDKDGYVLFEKTQEEV